MVKKQKDDIKQALQIKEEDSSTQKVISFLSRTFCGEKGIEKQINIFVVSNTYYTLLQIVHTVLLFSMFNKSNSATYSIVQSAIGGYFFLVYLIPRVSKKHMIFQTTLILYLLGFIASGLTLIVLFQAEIKNFYAKRQQSEYLSKSMCQTVYQIYIIELIVEVFILLLRVLYLSMCFRAYIIAQENYDQEQKKKRRRDRYNQLLLKRTMYNDKRKV